MGESTGPSVGAPEQVIAALEDGKLIFLIPHVDPQGEVEGSSEDSALVHPQGRDGLLVVLEGCQPQALDGEEHQLRPRHQQDQLRAMALHEVRGCHGVWQEETCNLLYFFK